MTKNHLPEIKQKNSFITDEFEMHKETFRSVLMANNKNWIYAKNFIWINKWQPFRWDMSRINFIIHNCTCTKLHELKPDKLLLTIYIQCKYHHWLAKYLPQLTGYFWHHYFHSHLMVKINTTWNTFQSIKGSKPIGIRHSLRHLFDRNISSSSFECNLRSMHCFFKQAVQGEHAKGRGGAGNKDPLSFSPLTRPQDFFLCPKNPAPAWMEVTGMLKLKGINTAIFSLKR